MEQDFYREENQKGKVLTQSEDSYKDLRERKHLIKKTVKGFVTVREVWMVE